MACEYVSARPSRSPRQIASPLRVCGVREFTSVPSSNAEVFVKAVNKVVVKAENKVIVR